MGEKYTYLLVQDGYHILDENDKLLTAEELCERLEKLEIALELAFVLLGHGDFRNGNTDPSGIIDEGEVYASYLMDKIVVLAPEIYNEALKKT